MSLDRKKFVCTKCGTSVKISPGRYPSSCKSCGNEKMVPAQPGLGRQCRGCGFEVPKYPGAYPDNCPKCSNSLNKAFAKLPEAADLVDRVLAGESPVAVVESKEALDAFMQEWRSHTWENPLDRYERGLGKMMVFELRPFDGMIHISSMRNIGDRQQGEATRAMRWLVDLADEHGVGMTLNAEPFGNTDITASQLKRFYSKFGFKPDGGFDMIRPAKGG